MGAEEECEDKAEEEKEVQGKRGGKGRERMEGLLQLPQVHPVGSRHARKPYPTLCNLVPEEQ